MTHEMPWLSAVSAGTELLVTTAVFYVLYKAVVWDVLKTRILAVALGYEVAFNISYMTWRLLTHPEPSGHPPWMIALVAVHGTLSLSMFLALVAFAVLAWRRWQRGQNFFRDHRVATFAFAGLWMVSLLSGEAIFWLEYVAHV